MWPIFLLLICVSLWACPAEASRLFSSGFELNSLTAGVEFDAVVSGPISIQGDTVHSGSYALKVAPASNGGYAQGRYTPAGAGRTYYTRFYLRIHASSSSSATVFDACTAGNSYAWGLRLESDDTLQLIDGSSNSIGAASAPLSKDTDYRVEVSYTYTGGAVTARLNGVPFASGTATAAVPVDSVRMGCDDLVGAGEWYLDDVTVNDDQGSYQNTWAGEGKLLLWRPNAAGDANSWATQVGGTAGAANNYTRVSEAPPFDDATSYNGSNTLNQEDMYRGPSSGLAAGDTVNLVAVGYRFRRSSNNTGSVFTPQIKKAAGGTIATGTALQPNSTTWRTNANSAPWAYPLLSYRDPDGSPWTAGTLNTMQIGMKLTTANSNLAWVSAVWALVDYTPGGSLSLAPGSLASGEAAGAPLVTTGAVNLTPAGGISGEGFGTPALNGLAGISPPGLASGEMGGAPALSQGAVSLAPAGIAGAEAWGTPTVQPGAVDLQPPGLATAAAAGQPLVLPGPVVLLPGGLGSAENLGQILVAPGPAAILPAGLSSREAGGLPLILPGDVVLLPLSLGSNEGFGAPALTQLATQTILPAGLPSVETWSHPVVVPGPVVIFPPGMAAAGAFGSAALALDTVIRPAGMSSREAFGLPWVAARLSGPIAAAPVVKLTLLSASIRIMPLTAFETRLANTTREPKLQAIAQNRRLTSITPKYQVEIIK